MGRQEHLSREPHLLQVRLRFPHQVLHLRKEGPVELHTQEYTPRSSTHLRPCSVTTVTTAPRVNKCLDQRGLCLHVPGQ